MATKIGELVWKITGDTRSIDKSTKKTEGNIGKLGKTMIKAFTGAAVIAAVVKLAGFFKRAGEAAAVQESAVRRLGAALEVTGQSGGNALYDLQEFASELQQITVIGDEATLALLQTAINMGLNKDEAKKATEQAIALSRAYGIDAKTALIGVTNTMRGQTSTLTRYIPSLKLAADETERIAILNNEAAKAMAIAREEVNTAAGAQIQLNNALGDSRELIGNYVNVGLTPLRKRLLDVTESFNDLLAAKQNINKALAGEVGAAGMKTAIEDLDKEIRGLEDHLDGVAGKIANVFLLGVPREIMKTRLRNLTEQRELLQRRYGDAMMREGQRADAASAEAKDDADKLQSLKDQAATLKTENEEYWAIVAAAEALAENEAYTAKAFEAREQERRDALAARINASAEALYAERAAEEARHQERLANLQAELAAASQYAGNVGTIFNNLIQIQMAGDEELTTQKKKNIITLYRIQQAANIAQIVVDTAAGIVKAWANPGFPLAIPLTALIAGIGITQAAVVAATPPPVALAEGGIIPARPGGTSAILGEGGQDEAVIPLDDSDGLGAIRIIVNLDGQPILDVVQLGLNNREIVVEAGSVV